MSGIFLPQRWKRKPSGLLTLNEASPFVGNPIFLHAMDGPRSLTGRAHLYSFSGDIWGQDTAEGSTLVAPAGMYEIFTVSGEFTLLVRFKTTDTYGAIFGGRLDSSDNPVLDLSVGHNGVGDYGTGNAVWIVRDDLTGLTHSGAPDAVGAVGDGAWHTCVMTRRWVGGDSLVDLYVDGKYVTYTSRSGVTASGPITLGGGTYASYLNELRNTSVGQLSPASVSLGFLTQKGVSKQEAQELSKNPWQLVRKDAARVYFFPSAGGGATITGDSGSYTLTGTAATLKVGRKLTADSGTYSLTGTDVAFKRGYALSAESGTYTVSGTAVDLKAGRKLTADSGSYTLTGTDVTLNYSPAGSYNLTAESGTYTLTGTAATLKVSRKLTADSGTYALTGTAAGLAKGVRLTAESGSYTLTGSNVAFARTYVLTAESGAYTLTGTSAGLTWSGAPVVEVPTNGGPSIYGKPVFREKQFRKEYEEQVKRIEDEKRLARILREDEEITVIMALMAA